jgi:hypothetical protein
MTGSLSSIANLFRFRWRPTSTSCPFVNVVRSGGRTTMSLVRQRWIQQPFSPRPATRLVGRSLLHSPWPATRLARWPHQNSWLHPRRGTMPPSQTPQRAHSTTGHIPACEVPTPRGMSMGWIMVAIQPPDSIRRRRRGCLQGGVYFHAEAGLEDTSLWGPVWPSVPQRPKSKPSDVLRPRERESQSSHALEGIMARMERHLVASTPAPAASTAPHPAPFYPGKFHSFHFHFELLKICLYFTFRGFTPLLRYRRAATSMAGPSGLGLG